MKKNFKLKFILTLFLLFFASIKPSYSNNFEEVSACAGVVMADGSIELAEKRNVKDFEVAFEIAIKAFYGEGLSQEKSSKDIANAEKIMMSNFENILNLHGSDEAYNEIIRCYRMTSYKLIEQSEILRKNSNMIYSYVSNYSEKFKKMILGQ